MIFLIQIHLQLTNSSGKQSLKVLSSNFAPAKERKRPKQIQGFVDSWLLEPQFKSWLTKKIGTGKKAQPFCKTCSKFVTCSKTSLKQHQTSTYHKRCHELVDGTANGIYLTTKQVFFELHILMEILSDIHQIPPTLCL